MTNPLPLILAALPLIVLIGTLAYIAIELLGAVRIGLAKYDHLQKFYDQQRGKDPQCYTNAGGRTPYPAEKPDRREIVRKEMRREWRRWTGKE